jgi:GNAT superfamily N-acetyltransferase
VAYQGILTEAQIKYMLHLLYATPVLQQAFESGSFAFSRLKNNTTGFVHYELSAPDTVKLQKLYVLPGYQQTGSGRALVQHVAQQAREASATQMVLRVNRHNPARAFYQRLGFGISHEEVTDIGAGYVMDDYVMVRPL